MIRERILCFLKEKNASVLRWQDCNSLWNDLHYQYGISENDFWDEIKKLINEGSLIIKDKYDPHPRYHLSENFMNNLKIKR